MSKLPNLLIGGVPKAGTTSLFTYLADHPAVCGTGRKEVNHFLPTIHGHPAPALSEYDDYFSHCGETSSHLLEASPRYLFGGGTLAARIRDAIGNYRAIFLLREPTERFYSFYLHRRRYGDLPISVSFETYVSDAITAFDSFADSYEANDASSLYRFDKTDSGLAHGCYANYLAEWMEVLGHRVSVYHFEDLKGDARAFMTTVASDHGIAADFYDDYVFEVQNRTVHYRSQTLYGLMRRSSAFLEGVLGGPYVTIKKKLQRVHDRVNSAPIEVSPPAPMSEAARDQLHEFYAPYRRPLAVLLSAREQSLPSWLSGSET